MAMRSVMKGKKTVDGKGFTLVWHCWAGEPCWYLENQLTLVLPIGQVKSRIARDRIEDTWNTACQMASSPFEKMYLTEGQGFSLECVRDLVSEVLIEVQLTGSIRFRGKIEPVDLKRFLHTIMHTIHGREIPGSNPAIEEPRNPMPAAAPDLMRVFGSVSLAFKRSADRLICVATSPEAVGILGFPFSSPLPTWISILEAAILQLALDEHAYSHYSCIKLGVLEFEIDRDDERFNAIICVGTDCHIVVAIESDQPYQELSAFLLSLKSELISEFGVGRL